MLLPLFMGAALFALPGCSPDPNPPGTVTPDEERQLDDAATMLDANSVALDNIEEQP